MTPDGPHEWRPSRLKPSEIGCHLGRVVLLGKDFEDTQGSGATDNGIYGEIPEHCLGERSFQSTN